MLHNPLGSFDEKYSFIKETVEKAANNEAISLTSKEIELLYQTSSELALLRGNPGQFAGNQSIVPAAWFLPLWLAVYEITQGKTF